MLAFDWPGPQDKEVKTNQIGLLRIFMAPTQDSSYLATIATLAEIQLIKLSNKYFVAPLPCTYRVQLIGKSFVSQLVLLLQ